MTLRVEKDGIDVTAAGRIVSGTFCKIFVIDFPAKGPMVCLGRGATGGWRSAVERCGLRSGGHRRHRVLSGLMVPS
jgi:hypothetical protein